MQVITNMRNAHRKKVKALKRIKSRTANADVPELLGLLVLYRRTTLLHSDGSSYISFTHSNHNGIIKVDIKKRKRATT